MPDGNPQSSWRDQACVASALSCEVSWRGPGVTPANGRHTSLAISLGVILKYVSSLTLRVPFHAAAPFKRSIPKRLKSAVVKLLW